MQYLLYILSIPFLYLNYEIIKSDLKEKKIPNKYLGYLLVLIPFFYIVYFLKTENINVYIYFFHFVLAFIISFILYYYGVWAAGDAKYLLILSLFIPNIGIVTIIGNIALITISYLLLYFFWFYLFKIPLNKGYAKSILINIKQDLSEKWKIYKSNKGGNNIFIILKWLLVFLTIFVSFRLARLYIFNAFLPSYLETIKILVSKYGSFILLGLIMAFIGITILIRKIYYKISNKLIKRYNINKKIVENVFLFSLLFLLIIFITYEYSLNPKEISNSLYKILTIYISINILIKILLYSYKITFGLAESDYINIDNLKVGDMIDKVSIIKDFGNQDSLGNDNNSIYGGSVTDYFNNFRNPVGLEDLEIIKKSFTMVNDFQKKQDSNFNQELNQIKIHKTFAFGPYIFFGFLMTFIFGNKIFVLIINSIVDVLKGIVN